MAERSPTETERSEGAAHPSGGGRELLEGTTWWRRGRPVRGLSVPPPLMHGLDSDYPSLTGISRQPPGVRMATAQHDLLNEQPIRVAEYLGAQAAVRLEVDGSKLRPRVLLGFYCPESPGHGEFVTHNLAVGVEEIPSLLQDLGRILVGYAVGDPQQGPTLWLDFLENVGPLGVLDPRD